MNRGIDSPRAGERDRSELAVLEFREGSTVRVVPFGELDMFTRAQVESALIRAESSGATLVELDFGGLTFMDSSGVHLALDALGRAREKGHRLVLHEGTGAVQRVFTLTGTEHLFGPGA
jgi:anti-sigma B factor antagonist